MTLHKQLASGRWFQLSEVEQLANVGTDIERAIRWKNKGDEQASEHAFERAIDLLSLTISDPKHKGRRKELTRIREALNDYFLCDNQYGSTDELWHNYFLNFNYAAAIQRGR